MSLATDMGGFPSVGGVARFSPVTDSYPELPGLSMNRARLTRPRSSDFSFISSGLTMTDLTDRMQITVTASAALKIATIPIIAAPYTIDFVGWIGSSTATTDGTIAGIALYDGTKGYITAGGPLLSFQEVSVHSATTLAGITNVQRLPGAISGGMWYIRVTDDGTNRQHLYSGTGKDYALFLSHATNTFLTPTQWGLATYNGSTSPAQTAKGFIAHLSITAGILGDAP